MTKLQRIACPCEKKFHTVDLEKPEWVQVLELIKLFGEVIEVQVFPDDTVYLIPRFSIAIHGLKGSEVPELGFPIKEKKETTA